MRPSSVFLNCITSGLLPTTVIWSKDGVMLSQNITTQRLTNPATALYSNILSWDMSGGENLRGMYSCNVYMDWITADNSRSGRQRKCKIRMQSLVNCIHKHFMGYGLLGWLPKWIIDSVDLKVWVKKAKNASTYLATVERLATDRSSVAAWLINIWYLRELHHSCSTQNMQQNRDCVLGLSTRHTFGHST